MRIDRTTKALLGVIAVALLVLALNPWLRPQPVLAQGGLSLQEYQVLTDIRDSLKATQRSIDVMDRSMQSVSTSLVGIVSELEPRSTLPKR